MVKAPFDTNILIDYLKGISQARTEIAFYETKAISIISWMEVMAGAAPEIEALNPRLPLQLRIYPAGQPHRLPERAALRPGALPLDPAGA